MPEYAELHSSAHQVAAASVGYTFTRVLTRGHVPSKPGTVGVGDHSRCPLEVLPTTADWRSFEIFARHRGKEVGLVLVERGVGVPVSRRPFCCPTCIAVHQHKSGGAGGNNNKLAPKCEHGESATLHQVKKNGANHGRHFFSCYLPMWSKGKKGSSRALSRCSFFQWADNHAGGAFLSSDDERAHMEALFRDREHAGEVLAGDEQLRVVRLTFRRGMKGKFLLLTKEQLRDSAQEGHGEQKTGEENGANSLLASSHVCFERSDGARLLFVDKRPRYALADRRMRASSAASMAWPAVSRALAFDTSPANKHQGVGLGPLACRSLGARERQRP